jgi:hypothetical protein
VRASVGFFGCKLLIPVGVALQARDHRRVGTTVISRGKALDIFENCVRGRGAGRVSNVQRAAQRSTCRGVAPGRATLALADDLCVRAGRYTIPRTFSGRTSVVAQ